METMQSAWQWKKAKAGEFSARWILLPTRSAGTSTPSPHVSLRIQTDYLTNKCQPERPWANTMPVSQRIHTTSHWTGKRHTKRLMCHHSASVSGRRSERYSLRPTAAGLDGLPAWLILRVAAPVFCKPVAYIFNLSLQTSTVPQQWKEARIRPVPKVAAPAEHSDFRPISVTPILTRPMERAVVRDFLYPAFHTPPCTLTYLLRPICFSPNRVHHSSYHHATQHSYRPVAIKSIRRGNIFGFQ